MFTAAKAALDFHICNKPLLVSVSCSKQPLLIGCSTILVRKLSSMLSKNILDCLNQTLLLPCSLRLSYNSDAIPNLSLDQIQIWQLMLRFCFKIKLVALWKIQQETGVPLILKLVMLEMHLQLNLTKKNQLLTCKISWTSHSVLLNRCAPHSLGMGEGRRESNISSGRIKLREGKGKMFYLEYKSWKNGKKEACQCLYMLFPNLGLLYCTADFFHSTVLRCVLWSVKNIRSVNLLWNFSWNQDFFP